MTTFTYPPLPTDRNAIRILTIQPGDFDDQIRSTLTPVPFTERPKYIALSYTWADPYPDDLRTPTIPCREGPAQQTADLQTEVLSMCNTPESIAKVPANRANGADFIIVDTHQFPVQRNLSLALRHLRSPTHPLHLWVDAICIDQQNEKERNVHVAMMSFIYKRATMVVAWLGARRYKGQFNYVQTLRNEWKMGQTQRLVTYMVDPKRPQCSEKPDTETFQRVIRSAYWARVWIIQEFCLAQNLVIAYGSKLWSYKCIRSWDNLQVKKVPSDIGTSGLRWPGFESMVQLFDARESKHTKEMTLECLVETFSKAACGRVQDKIYGLLGLANDITPDPTTNEDTVDPITRYIRLLDIRDEVPPDPPTGRASFKVDYSRPLFQIWTDVLKTSYFRAGHTNGRHIETALADTLTLIPDSASLAGKARHLVVVRSSGVLQAALRQQVEEEVMKSGVPKSIYHEPIIRAIGYLGGEILELGPSCASLIEDPSSQPLWDSCLEAHYPDACDIETLRGINERYMATLLDYEDKDLSRFRAIIDHRIVAWSISTRRPQSSDPAYIAKYEDIWNNEQIQLTSLEQRICVCTGRQIAVVPSAARTGDIIIRFWSCNTAILMRPYVDNTSFQDISFMLVGRADVVEAVDEDTIHGTIDPRAVKGFSGSLSPTYAASDFEVPGAVYVDLNFNTLQLITSSIAVEAVEGRATKRDNVA
ncbi:heterokaryon incompatibility protein-domain-containing protein [Hypomontagnella monticulosa]|nr:heterokaryon incompatibility protein-domain-containing protein [Hypomontagnella monticulosa]